MDAINSRLEEREALAQISGFSYVTHWSKPTGTRDRAPFLFPSYFVYYRPPAPYFRSIFTDDLPFMLLR